MAGLALLPWEKWIARLLHPLYVRLRRQLYRKQRGQDLDRSEGWLQTTGRAVSIRWDSSLPRQEVSYSFSCQQGYFSGTHWHWFEREDTHEVRVGDQVVLRYCAEKPEESVFLDF